MTNTFDSDRAMTLCGVAGRLTHRVTVDVMPRSGNTPAAGTWFKQRWISERRLCANYGEKAEIRAEVRFDDELGNGHNSFAITADITERGRSIAGGCCHEEIAAAFPELTHLIRWHLCATDGPMHYIANAVYLAGDRDHNGLRKGERRPLQTRDGAKMWELVADNALGVALSDTPTGLGYRNESAVPLFILQNRWTGEEPPITPKLVWKRSERVGEGKARELDSARSVSCWPDATDAELSVEPDELRAALAVRLPALLKAFRADMDAAGLFWSPSDFVAVPA